MENAVENEKSVGTVKEIVRQMQYYIILY